MCNFAAMMKNSKGLNRIFRTVTRTVAWSTALAVVPGTVLPIVASEVANDGREGVPTGALAVQADPVAGPLFEHTAGKTGVPFGGSPGLEIVRPTALAIIGGLPASTLVALFVVPALYLLIGAGAGRRSDLGLAGE